MFLEFMFEANGIENRLKYSRDSILWKEASTAFFLDPSQFLEAEFSERSSRNFVARMKVFKNSEIELWTVSWQGEEQELNGENNDIIDRFHWNIAARILSMSNEKFLQASGIKPPLKVAVQIARL